MEAGGNPLMRSMRPLLYKEFRSLLPFLALVLFFIFLNWMFLFLAEYPDQYPLSRLLTHDNRTTTQALYFIMAFALAAGLLVRERDEGTLSFLDGLPVSRTRVFFCKAALALSVLWLLPACDFVFNTTVHTLSRTSLEGRSRADLLLTAALLDAAACFVYFSLGLALSFLRRYSLLVMGLLFWVYVLLKEAGLPFVPLLNIFSLGDPVFEGQRWLVPWTKLAAQLGMAIICAGTAFTAFHFSGDSASRLASRIGGWRGRALITGITTVFIIGVWLGLAIYWARKSDNNRGPGVTYASWATGRAHTVRYQMLYPTDRGAALQPLLEEADAVEAKVRSFLGAEPLDPIVVDLTSFQPRHAGRAYWQKVHMNLPFENSGETGELIPVLAHETTHVFIENLAGKRLHEEFDSTRFFHEGLASYVEYHLFRPTNALARLRRVAAVARARDEVKLEELFDDAKLSLKRDRDVAYPLGEVFVAALVRRYGETAPGQVLRAFARTNAPKELSGFALWQDTFQACGYDLSDVSDGFFAELDRLVTEHRSSIEGLPRLRGAVTQSRDLLKVRVSYEGDPPGNIVCRFRPRGDTEERFIEFADSSDGRSSFHVDASDYPDRSFWYQLGWVVEGASQAIYEPWVVVRRR
jgi:ABC-type transport system involved in multi-copper enzyme maturation permease subunit